MRPIEYIVRETGERRTESVMGGGALRFAYETLLGRTLWPVLFGSKAVSALMGLYYDSRLSRGAIKLLASIPGCKADEAEKPIGEYGSFNEFFTRRLKDGARPVGEGFASPADGRLMLYPDVGADDPIPVKKAVKPLKEVLCEEALEGRFDVAVVRLAPVDYHRFHFPCDMELAGETKVVAGRYDSVSPIALAVRPDVYAGNERQIVRGVAGFGEIWMVDVGAFGVGTIVQTFKGARQKKGAEKGYFKFGGSTVIVVTRAGAVKYCADIVRNSAEGVETLVKARERLGDA
ncbi:MAG: phosphatidylserine decarboxylase [Kiritimatiellae bacterium]|nr:phosphatidylserine decarboxylase [Kiritimatiellia bacterium]